MYTFKGNETAELFAAFGRIGNYLLTGICPKLRWPITVTQAYVVGDDEFRMTLRLVNPRELSEESQRKGHAATVRCEFVRSGRLAIERPAMRGTESFSELCASCKPSDSAVWVVLNWDRIDSEISGQLNRQSEFVRDLGTILPGRSCEV